jgi:hypothetical protein
LYLVGWNLFGIFVVDEIIGAGISTQAAVSADLQPGAYTGFAGILDCCGQGLFIHIQLIHLLVVSYPTPVTQEGLELFHGIYWCLIAK